MVTKRSSSGARTTAGRAIPDPAVALAIFRDLFGAYGPRHWWPAQSDFEVLVGAILTQNTAWTNVERAIANLRDASALDPQSIATMPRARLEVLIRPSGYFRQKAKRLQQVVRAIYSSAPDLQQFLRGDTEQVRQKLLALPGIGPETADSILLYAGTHPTFVVDAYTLRLAQRFPLPVGAAPGRDDYHRAKAYFEGAIAADLQLYREFHALIVELGKGTCRPKPKCERCPLQQRCAQKL